MTSVFPSPNHANKQGKKNLLAQLDLQVRLSHWQDCIGQSVPVDQPTLTEPVTVTVSLAQTNIVKFTVDNFGPLRVDSKFDDSVASINASLDIEIQGLNQYCVFEIDKLWLQGIEIQHLLPTTQLAKNGTVSVPVDKPVWSWLVKNHRRVLPWWTLTDY